MALHFDGKTTNDFELIKPGTYEVITKVEWAKTRKTGDQYINCVFTIRDDIEQEFGGRIVFDGIYKSKQTGDFNASKINGLLSTIPNARTDFSDYDELIQYLNGIKLAVEIIVEKIDPQIPDSKEKNSIKFLSYKKSAFKEFIDPEDLPF